MTEGATIGEVEDVEPGSTKRVTLDPGRYLLICNIVGHASVFPQEDG